MRKIPPRRRPATMADVERAKRDVFDEAVTFSAVIFLTTLCDKFGGADYIADVWREVNELSISITEGYVTVSDLRNTLKKEYEIEM